MTQSEVSINFQIKQSSLKVHFEEAESHDKNGFNVHSFVLKVFSIVINMLANDLNVSIERSDGVSSPQNVDIFIKTLNEGGDFNESLVEMVWPHYQNRYCFIYANTKLVFTAGVMTYTNWFLLLNAMVWIINIIFFFIVYRYRYD